MPDEGKQVMRRTLALAAGSLLLVATAACSATEDKVTNKPAQSGPSSPGSSAPGQAATPAEEEAKVGDTLNLTGITDGEKLAVTVVKIVDPARAENQFSTPEPGTRFVSVQFRLRNTGDQAYNDAPSNGAKVVDTEGQSFDASLLDETTAGPAFTTTTIAVGSTGSGWITFEVPATSKLAKVQFTMNSGFSNDTGEWLVP